ncbi:unnamed protein product, partial [Symbiodinium sp. CCMP2592]
RALQGLPSQAAPAVPAQPVETTAVPDPASAAVFAEAPVNPRPASPASAAVSAEAPVPTPASPAPAAVSAGAPLPPAKPASAAAVSAEAPLPTPASPAPAAVSAGAPLPPARPASAAAESAEAPVPTAASPASAVSAEAPLPTLASSAAVSAKAPVPAPAGVPTVPAVRASGEATAAVFPWPCNYVAAAAASSPASAAVFATAPVPVVEAPVPTPASLAAAVSASAPVPTPASPASAAVSAGALLPTVSAEAPVPTPASPAPAAVSAGAPLPTPARPASAAAVCGEAPVPTPASPAPATVSAGAPLPTPARPASAAAVSAETPLPTPASLASAAVSAGRPASTAVSAKAPPPTLARPASAAAPAEAPVPTLASPASAAVSAEAPVPRPLMLAVPHTTFFAAAAEAVPTQPAVDRPSLKRRPPIDPDALPVLTPEHKAKYANYWTSYFKKQKSESELSMPSTPPTTSPTTPASTVDSNDMLESLMQKARHDSAFLSRLLSLAGLDSPSASVAPPLSTSSAPASLDPVPSQVPPQPAPAVAAAVPTVPNPALTAAPAAPAMPVVTVPEAAPASAMQTLEVAVQQEDFKCTSKTHPAAWAKMNRFVARNEVCKELGKAWQAGGDTRLSMFQKWVAVNGRGLDLEAAVQMKVIRETEEVDQGVYVSWSGVLAHFEQDINKSLAFAARRRAEHKGTKRDRNDPTVEKFLLWNDATVTDEVCLEVGCKVADVEQLLSSMDSDPLFYKRNALPERGAPDSTVTEAKAKAKFQKEMYTELPADCCADDVQEFVTSWMAAVSDAQGQAAILCSELQDLESQEKLMGLIDSVKLQLADLRKEMGAINVGSEDALTLVAAVCDKAKPLVNLYKITAEKQQTMPAKKKSKTDLKNEEGNE